MQNKREGKYTKVANKVITDLSLKASDKSVYMVLSRYADNITRECFPSRDTLMKYAGVSDKTLRLAIKNLVDRGYISVESRRKGGRRSTNLYRLL